MYIWCFGTPMQRAINSCLVCSRQRSKAGGGRLELLRNLCEGSERYRTACSRPTLAVSDEAAQYPSCSILDWIQLGRQRLGKRLTSSENRS